MALARDKIVKLENFGAAGVHFGEDTILGSRDSATPQSKYLALQSAPAYLERGIILKWL